MKDTSPEQKKVARSEYWRERIAEQERSGLSVARFCQEQGLTEQTFYVWRKRLRERPLRFALVETGSPPPPSGREAGLELGLPRGERLYIGTGVDPTLLRTVLDTLRA